MKLQTWCITLTAALGLSACGGDDPEPKPSAPASDDFDYTAMMANYADNIIIPGYREAETIAARLEQSVADHCDVLGTDIAEPTLTRARRDWRELMAQWQRSQALQVGPVLANGGALGNRIYDYMGAPLSTCGVDQSVVLASEDGFDLAGRSFSARGLDAIEYLLFNPDLTHTCPQQIPQTQNWNERPESERRQLRCNYAQQLAGDVHDGLTELVEAWEPAGGDYRFEFVNPNNQETSLKALSDGLFYIELNAKDAKLGVPMGLHNDCSAASCPDAVESPYAANARANLQANIEGFGRAFTGGEGPGFDDLIEQAGYRGIVNDFNRETEDAAELAATMEEPLLDQAERLAQSDDATACLNAAANPDYVSDYPACSLHGLVKRLTDRLRTDFITIVNLDLPERGQSDND